MLRPRCMLLLVGAAFGLTLGWSAIGSTQELSTAEPVLKQFLAEAADQGKSQHARFDAIRGLGQWGTTQVTSGLLPVLDDRDPAIRAEVAAALGFEGNQAATTPLLARLTSPAEDPRVRATAAAALGRIGA